jgi:hypothetical protein
VKKDTKEKVMVNCGSMTFVLRSKRVYPPLSSHESVPYWNAGWFYIKNESIPGRHDGLPAFPNNPLEELSSWSYIPNLAQQLELDKMARRISKLVHDGLTGMDLTLSWFTRRIQPLKFNKRLICEYSGAEYLLRVTKDNLPTDSLNKRIRTLVKITRDQVVPDIVKDIYINNTCPLVCFTLGHFAFRLCMYLTFQHFLSSSILWRRKISELFSAPPSTLGRRRKLRRRRKKKTSQQRKKLLVPPNVPAANPSGLTLEPAPRARPRKPKPLHPPGHGTTTPRRRNAIASRCSRLPEKELVQHFPEPREFP